MNYRKVESFSAEKPLEVDATSSRSVVYLRKNIEAVPNVDSDGTHWRMDEAQLTKDQYAQYQQVRAAAEERSEAIMQALSDAEADRELRAIAEDSNTETVMQAISDLQADIAMMAAE